MVESTTFILGLAAGLLFGGLAGGLWWSTRLRTQFEAKVTGAAERAQRAETLAEELRRCSGADHAELDHLRNDLAEAVRARAVAETQTADTVKHVEEQKLLLAQARHDLAAAFQALSGEALKQNNEAFLSLAKTTFHTLHAATNRGIAVQGKGGRTYPRAAKGTRHGEMRRDFTYIDDIVAGTIAVLRQPAQPDPSFDPFNPSPKSSEAPYRVYNIGNHESVELLDFIGVLEDALGVKAQVNMLPLQPGDVLETYANIDALQEAVDYKPTTPIQVGIPRFVEWYRDYFMRGRLSL